MKHRFTLVGWLTIVWIGLWGDLSWANLAGGVATGGGLVLLFDPREPLGLRIRPLPLIRFISYFIWNLAHASLQVALAVIAPRPILRKAVIAVPINSTTRGITLVIAAAISLTPGTLVIETSERDMETILYIHVLDLRNRAKTQADVARLEQLVHAAFSPNPKPPRSVHSTEAS